MTAHPTELEPDRELMDDLTKALTEIEARFAQTYVAPAETRLGDGVLAFKKHDGERGLWFQGHVVGRTREGTTITMRQDGKPIPLAKAPLHIRTAAVAVLPDLKRALDDANRDMAASVKQAVEDAATFLAELRDGGSDG